MSDTGNAELQNQLQALNERFVERLRQELPELARTAGELQEPLPRERLRQLMLDIHEQLHRLAGSAGTFGFARLGEQARSLELHADRWLAAAKPGTQSLHGFARALQRFASDALAESPEQATAVPQTQQHRPDCLIYLLESDAQAGHDMGQTLGNFGYDVRLFTELAQLEAAAADDLPEALVIGLQHGGELAAVSELQQRLPAHLPLLVISDRADFDSLLTAVRAGAQGYFLRPLDITQLESCLERCLNRHLGAPFRVMIVDDDADLAARYSLVLRNSQMLVQTLQDPSLLLETMRTFNPEVLLLDVNMPHCSGPELAQMIRLNDEWLRVPIIYLSAETDINRQMEALLKAGDDFITKPISDNALIASVYSHAQRARSLSTALSRDSLTGLLKHADIKEQLALTGSGTCGALRQTHQRGHARPRPLQAGQRHLRPRRRRQRDPRAGQPAAPAPAPHRQPRPLRRRGIRRGAARVLGRTGQTHHRGNPLTLLGHQLPRRGPHLQRIAQRRHQRNRRPRQTWHAAGTRRPGAVRRQAQRP